MNKYDIYSVDFMYYSDRNESKVRPALILNIDALITIAEITSHEPRTKFDYFLEDWKELGLTKPSCVRLNKIQLINPNKINKNKYIGTLSNEDIEDIKKFKLFEWLNEDVDINSKEIQDCIKKIKQKFPNVYIGEFDKDGASILSEEFMKGWEYDMSIQESIEKHDKLNPDLFENNELKEDVKDSVKNIVNTFEEIIKKDGVKFKVKDIVLVGSNVSYNYTDDSDLDIHIIADSSVVKDTSEQSKKYLGILYNLYKSMFNSDYDITIHGVPAEVYVELDDIGAAKSNGIYSLNSGWIKEPVQEDIPDIDMKAFRKEFEEWERKYKELIKALPQVDLEENTNTLEESSITRIGRQLEFENVAIISAYRYDKSTKENEQRQDELKNIIRNKLHLGYKEFRAKYVGNVEGTGEVITSYEYSLFVPNMTRKQTIKLGNQFDQQAIIVKDEDGIQEIATTDFIDDKGKQFKIGDVIRKFKSTGNFLNIKDAMNIFADRVSGSASKPLNLKHPFTLKTIEDKKLESIFEVLDPKPSAFQTAKSYVMVYDSKSLNEAGYHGYSMSNNAVAAYEMGEKPKSKWTKEEILDCVKDVNLRNKLSRLSVTTLRDNFLFKSSWHHTGKMYNKTEFYMVDEDEINNVTDEDIENLKAVSRAPKVEEKPRIKKGSIDYLTWEGTRKHPKPVEHTLSNVNIEEKGSFYIITDDSGKEILRKKIGSNGTKVRYN